MPKVKVENFYRTKVTSTSPIPASGDFTFDVEIAPQNPIGFLILGSENISTRQIFFYSSVSGNTITVKGSNRITAAAITSPLGYSVKMNDVSEIFNYFGDNISTAFYLEKMGGLSVKVWGGYVMYNNAQQTVADTTLTIVDNTTSYIKYDPVTNTITSSTSPGGNVKCEVVANSGQVTSVLYRVSKESYLDFQIELTGALPSQTGQAGNVLGTNGTVASWVPQTPVTPSASQTVDGKVEVATTTEGFSGTDVGGTSSPLVIPPSVLRDSVTGTYVAGESISLGDIVTKEFQRAFAFSANTGVSGVRNMGNTAANTKLSIAIIGAQQSFSSMKLGLNKVGSPADGITIRIETDASGQPSGILANPAYSVAYIPASSLTGTNADITCTFDGNFTLAGGVPYHVVIQRTTGFDGSNYYQIGGYSRGVRSFLMRTYNGTVWSAATGNFMPYVSSSGVRTRLVVKASAGDGDLSNFIGFSRSTVVSGGNVQVQSSGIIKGLSSLVPDQEYYLSDTPGQISSSPGTDKVIVGEAISATEFNVINDPKVWVGFSSIGTPAYNSIGPLIEGRGTMAIVELSGGNGGSDGRIMLEFSTDGTNFITAYDYYVPYPSVGSVRFPIHFKGFYRLRTFTSSIQGGSIIYGR